jgi:hypothetical protein
MIRQKERDKKMQNYRIIWTYIANYGSFVMQAKSPEHAAEIVRKGFSDDFRKRGTIYVALEQNVHMFMPAKTIDTSRPL